jgi:hypothetical protein
MSTSIEIGSGPQDSIFNYITETFVGNNCRSWWLHRQILFLFFFWVALTLEDPGMTKRREVWLVWFRPVFQLRVKFVQKRVVLVGPNTETSR